jgi:multiple sugar transport system substrate-binding protein
VSAGRPTLRRHLKALMFDVRGGLLMRDNPRWPALVIGAVLVLAACTQGGATQAPTQPAQPTPADQPTQPAQPTPAEQPTPAGPTPEGPSGAMQMWERTGGNAPMVDALVAAWNNENPDRPIELTYVDHAQMVPNLSRAIASGEVPDLIGLDLIYGPQFASGGHLEDITDLISDDPNLTTAVPGHIEVATWEDRLYGVPLYADVSVLFWNKDLFRDAGLDPEVPPRSLDDIHTMATAITDAANGVYGYYLPGNCSGCNIFTFAPLIWATDPEAKIEPTGPGDDALVGEGIKPVLEWARMMHSEGLIDPAAQAETGETFAGVFGTGQVGIMGTGNFNVAALQDQNPDLDLGVTVLPGMEEGQSASFAGGDIVTVPKGSQRVQDAVDFMKWLLTDEVQLDVYAQALNMTTRTDLLDNDHFNANEDVRDTAQAIPIAKTPYTLKFFELINSPNSPWLQMLQRVFYTEDDIDQIIEETRAEMVRIANEP